MVNVPEISQAARENHTNYMNKEILQNIDSVVESISDEDVNNLAELYHMTKDDNEDEVIVNFNESEEVMDIKVEDLQDSEFSEYIPGSSDLIEIVKHEINVDDQDNTSHHNEDIDTKHDDEILDSDLSSQCVGFTDEEIAEAECRLESFKKIDAIFLANYKQDMSKYGCGTPTGNSLDLHLHL